MLIVGLTGTSGSGKGYVCSKLKRDKIIVIDTDSVYHSMIEKKSECVDAIASEFGAGVLNNNGGIDRCNLRNVVFENRNKLEILNRITHKFILAEVRKIISESSADGNAVAIVDAPVLFESGFDKECDYIVGITAPKDIRIQRIIQRDSITLEQATLRINSQKDDEFFINYCDYIIENDGQEIEEKINNLVIELMRLYEEKKEKICD